MDMEDCRFQSKESGVRSQEPGGKGREQRVFEKVSGFRCQRKKTARH